MQANVDVQLAAEEWPLEPLAIKMKQYCYLLEDLTADVLREQAGGDYELLRKYLRRRAVDAYWQKVIACDARRGREGGEGAKQAPGGCGQQPHLFLHASMRPLKLRHFVQCEVPPPPPPPLHTHPTSIMRPSQPNPPHHHDSVTLFAFFPT